ncbi:aminopeptidase C [Haloferula helveola]|uniref:Aminopeptidase n=1 Tax=Haloferula helveola TaxID=490095 RepID=A0ABN6GYC0_9BACT|nr:aminopeptidase C [Haloferula helveola]
MTPEEAALARRPANAPAPSSEGSLDPEVVEEIRAGYRMVEADRLRHNAVTNNAIDDLALNRQALSQVDDHFSHRIRSRGVTNQKKSGRCWMFAALNVIRPQVIRDHGMEEFEFSVAFLQFWDRMERANLFLESVIDLRDIDYLERDWELLNRWGMEDGGWWNYLAALVEKYGVVPSSVMPETHGSSNTATMNLVLQRLIRTYSAKLLNRHADGGTMAELRAIKSEALAEVYRFLVINLGEPPTEFEWRYRRTTKPDRSDPEAEMRTVTDPALGESESFTPKSFRKRYVGCAMSDFVCLYNDPKNELNRHYRFDRARNMVDSENMGFVNVDMDVIRQASIRSIKANEPLWFAVNMGYDQSRELGIMQDKLLDYEALFGIDLTLSKADRARFHSDVSNHAMALMGVDLDSEGRPKKWLVENSWGKEQGDEGFWSLHDDWFDEHVYTVIVHRRHVPDEVLAYFEETPTVLPAWYPGAAGVLA